MLTDSEKIKALFKIPTEAEYLSYQLDMMTFERDCFEAAFLRILTNQAKSMLTGSNNDKNK